MDYRRLLVRLMKEIMENDYSVVILEEDGYITGNSNYGFITDNGVYIPIPEEREEFKKDHNIPEEIPYQKIPLGYINDIIIEFNRDVYDEEEMENITDEIYHMIGKKFDLMTVESNPV